MEARVVQVLPSHPKSGQFGHHQGVLEAPPCHSAEDWAWEAAVVAVRYWNHMPQPSLLLEGKKFLRIKDDGRLVVDVANPECSLQCV